MNLPGIGFMFILPVCTLRWKVGEGNRRQKSILDGNNIFGKPSTMDQWAPIGTEEQTGTKFCGQIELLGDKHLRLVRLKKRNG